MRPRRGGTSSRSSEPWPPMEPEEASRARDNPPGGVVLRETLARAGAVAEALRAPGVRPGDRVLLRIEDGPTWVAAFGGLCGGPFLVPLDVASTAEFAQAVERRCASSAPGSGRPPARAFEGTFIDVDSLGPGDAALLSPAPSRLPATSPRSCSPPARSPSRAA